MKISFDKFVDIIKKKLKIKTKERFGDECIFSRYKIGGAEGGNCWGEEAETYTVYAPDDDFKDLDTIFKEFCPQIPYLDYKQFSSLVEDYSEENEYEYYGNYTTYKIEYIEIHALYQKMLSLNLFEEYVEK